MATEKIMMASGELADASYVRHLRTTTDGPRNMDVDLYRTAGGRLVVCTSPRNDGRAIPEVDPDSTPESYGIRDADSLGRFDRWGEPIDLPDHLLKWSDDLQGWLVRIWVWRDTVWCRP